MTPEAALTIIRLQLKHCPGCGYDVSAHGSVVCPECGLDLTTAAANWIAVTAEVVRRRRVRVVVASVLPNLAVFAWFLIGGLVYSSSNALWIVPLFFFAVASVPAAGIWLALFLTLRENRFRAIETAAWFVITAWLWPALVVTMLYVL